MNQIKKAKTNYKILFKPHISDKELTDWYSDNNNLSRECFFLYSACCDSPEGDMYSYQTIKQKLGNLKNTSIKDI